MPENPRLQRIHSGVHGGLDTFLRRVPLQVALTVPAPQNAFLLGDADHSSSANVRNAPHVLGLGFIQALGAEMSFEPPVRAIRRSRRPLRKAPADSGESAAVSLAPLGPPRRHDRTAPVSGKADSDPVVKPFG
ncbi:MAG: hypothetical protein R3F14_04860 [Polyangiaceae bacterium]